MIERKIIIGLITSTEYLQQIQKHWNPMLLQSDAAKKIAGWVWEYFDKFGHAPMKDIEGIFFSKLKDPKLPKVTAEEIQEDILPSLSKEFEKEGINVDYLLAESKRYFTERRLINVQGSIESLLAVGDVLGAEAVLCSYTPAIVDSANAVDLSSDEADERIAHAFEIGQEVLIRFPGKLGEFMNLELVRGAFVAIMAAEKRGKTFWLLELAMRGCAQNKKVAFFQAGDMTEEQQLRRICVYMAQKSDKVDYCHAHYEPLKDCKYNQINDCSKKCRRCNHGCFEDKSLEDLNTLTQADLIKAYNEYPNYEPCFHCDEFKDGKFGVPFVQKIPEVDKLTKEEAIAIKHKYFDPNTGKYKGRFRLSTHANGTLTTREILATLAIWEKEDGFVPDIVIVDYADLMMADEKEFRHKQNEIWKGLRRVSQEKHCLVITATQSDADSYEKNQLTLSNFSEDKRKYGHVTAMWGLNQDPKGREKKIGIMRINELVKREADYSIRNDVTILQNLKRGKPFITSY